IALRACQLSLVAGLLGDDRQDDCGDPFDLMPMRPGQQLIDILFEGCLRCGVRFWNYHSPSIAQVPTCYDTPIYKYVLTSARSLDLFLLAFEHPLIADFREQMNVEFITPEESVCWL